jgi:hypothetical protein
MESAAALQRPRELSDEQPKTRGIRFIKKFDEGFQWLPHIG